MIKIRKYQVGEETQLRTLFFDTIRNINIKDYSKAQVQAWAPDNYDETVWKGRIKAINPFVALIDNQIVGYADIQKDGYIDHFFCHSNYQGKGVGAALMKNIFEVGLAQKVARFYSHVSITAKPFFEHFGFKILKEQKVEIRDQILINYVMEKPNH